MNSKRLFVKKMLFIGIPSLLIAVMVFLLCFNFFKTALHLDFSQEYRKVKGESRILFRDSWTGKIYDRTFWGLRPVGIEDEVKGGSGEGVWYDAQENKIFLGNLAGEVTESFDTQYTVRQVELSPDMRYILYYEIEYGVNGGYSTDEEYCYYRVIDRESREQYTVYSGYREWYQVYWE